MSFFFPLKVFSINHTFNFYVKQQSIPFRLHVCNYAKKITTEKLTTETVTIENVSAIPVTAEMQPTGHLGYNPSQARDGALIHHTGTSYQTLVADNMRETLNLNIDNDFKCINNVDK